MKSIAAAAALISALGVQHAIAASFDDLNAGLQAHNLNQWGASVAAFDQALGAGDMSPNQQFIAHLDRGMAHQAMRNTELALSDYSAALAFQPSSAEALFARADLYLNIGKFQEAGTDLDTLITLRPMLARAYTLRLPVDGKLNKVGQSVSDAMKILSLLPRENVRSITTGIVAWQAGETGTAQDNFSFVAAQKEDGIYGWLWLTLTDIRSGKPVPKALLAEFDKNSWPAPIVSLFLGDGSQDAVFAAAGDGEDFLTRGRNCEANFYVGEWLLQHRDSAGAKPMIQKASEICPIDFVEWSPAQTELAALVHRAP